MLSKAQQDELYALLERVDELSITEGVDSPEYEETFNKLLLKQAEYGAYEEIDLSDDDNVPEALTTHGGPGSGNFGHSGRPGQVGGSTPAQSETTDNPELYKALNKYVEGLSITQEEKGLITRSIQRSTTRHKQLIRVSREDEKHEPGDTVTWGGPVSTTQGIDVVLSGKNLGHITWKSSDKALYLIENPKQGLDIDYDKVGSVGFDARAEEETLVTGRYRVKEKRWVTEPGTRPEYEYEVPMYVIEEAR